MATTCRSDEIGPGMQMSMNSAERGLPLSTGRIVDTRSPFVRLAELIADVKPGQPVIDLGVGEPKHPVPDFVGSGDRRAYQGLRALSAQ